MLSCSLTVRKKVWREQLTSASAMRERTLLHIQVDAGMRQFSVHIHAYVSCYIMRPRRLNRMTSVPDTISVTISVENNTSSRLSRDDFPTLM